MAENYCDYLNLDINVFKNLKDINFNLKSFEKCLSNNVFKNEFSSTNESYVQSLCKTDIKIFDFITNKPKETDFKIFKCFWPKCGFECQKVNGLKIHQEFH